MRQAAKPAQVLHAALARKMDSQMFTGDALSKDFFTCLKTNCPDVMHIHGCWNVNTAIACRIAFHYDIPVVISPHGMLAQSIIQNDFWHKLPRMLAYQVRTVRKAFVVHASTEQEEKDLKTLGWKKRISLIGITANEHEQALMVDRFTAFYQKIIDTVQRNKLSEIESKCFWSLLKADVSSRHEAVVTADNMGDFAKLTTDNWKAIQVFAIDHGVIDNINNAAQQLSVSIKSPLREAPVRYPEKSSLSDENKDNDVGELTETYRDKPKEFALALEIKALYMTICKLQKTEKCKHPMQTLITIYETVLCEDYDEQTLYEIVKKMGIDKFCGRLMQIFSEQFGLTIGFMPVDPINDRKKKSMNKNLNNLP